MPTNPCFFPQSVCYDVVKGKARGDIAATGRWRQRYAPFIPGAGGQLQKNMTLKLPRDRLDDRRQLLAQLDQINRKIDSAERRRGGQDPAAGLPGAPERRRRRRLRSVEGRRRTLARYDTSGYARADGWSKVSTRQGRHYTGHARSLGKLLLLARRLCEAGCGFVTIHAGYDGVWDMHADGNNLNMNDGMEAVGRASITRSPRSSRTWRRAA